MRYNQECQPQKYNMNIKPIGIAASKSINFFCTTSKLCKKMRKNDLYKKPRQRETL